MGKSQVLKYSSLQSTQSLVVTVICNLPGDLTGRSLANEREKYLYVTGGKAKFNDYAVDSAYKIKPKTKTATRLPDLNQGRCFHSSVIHGGRLYLIGGLSKYDAGITSDFVNVLDLKHPHAWGIIQQGQSLLRLGDSPLASSFSKDEILCFGGFDSKNNSMRSRVVTFNVKS